MRAVRRSALVRSPLQPAKGVRLWARAGRLTGSRMVRLARLAVAHGRRGFRGAGPLLALCMLSACASVAKVPPYFIECKGKGVISGTGHGSAGMGLAGSEVNAFNLSADCGDGFSFQKTDGAPPAKPASSQAPAGL